SALASVFIIATIGRFSRLQTFAYKIIMTLAVANLGLDFAYLMGTVGHDNWKCTLQGFGRVYFALVEFALVTAVTTTCYVMIVKRDFRIQEARKRGAGCGSLPTAACRFWKVMAYCWLIPLVMACLPFTTDNYGDAGAWCSITSKDLKSLVWGTFWRFAVIYVPLWVCIGVNMYMCFKVYRAMRGFEAAMVAYMEPREGEGEAAAEATAGTSRGHGSPSAAASGEGREGWGAEEEDGEAVRRGPGGIEMSTSIPIIDRLRLYPIALMVCWSWATVNRVREAIEPYGESMFWLFVLQYTFQVRMLVWPRCPGREELRLLSRWCCSCVC
ncbi:unnamed protein product, partial [Hapterophycus canaliculatus]